MLDDLENYAKTSNDDVSLRAVNECKASLNKLIIKMDGLETGFDRIAERSRGSFPVELIDGDQC